MEEGEGAGRKKEGNESQPRDLRTALKIAQQTQRKRGGEEESVLDICYHDSGECAIPNEDHHLERRRRCTRSRLRKEEKE